MAQPEQSEGEPSGCPLAGGSVNKMDLAAGLPPTTQRSKRRMIVISPREEKVVLPPGIAPRTRPSQSRVIALSLREENWSPPPESHRPGPTYKVGTSLATSDGHWSPRRVTLPGLALI
jgi:hypothetical protein